jgi:Ca2+-binding RTX toxin-like protein
MAILDNLINFIPWHGTPHDDKYDHKGSDNFYGFGYDGDDIIRGGKGNDRVDGGKGNDKIYGEYGDDYLYGGEGNGNDMIYGDHGHDVIDGGYGNDKLYGGYGDDHLYGGYGNDVLKGDDGRDRLDGEGESPMKEVESGSSMAPIDVLYGGKQGDTFVLGSSIPYYGNQGDHDYALIKDFNKHEGDQIELYGKKESYYFESSSVKGMGSHAEDTQIYHLNSQGEKDLIAIVQDASKESVMSSIILV